MFRDSAADPAFEDGQTSISQFSAEHMLEEVDWSEPMSPDYYGGDRLFVREHGSHSGPLQEDEPLGDTGDRPLIVGVHGSWHTDEFWNDTIASGVEMTAVNLSTDQPGTSFDTDSDEVIEVTDGFDEVLLVGHSRGGTVCLWAADKLLKRGVDCSVVLVNSAIDSEQIGRARHSENVPPRTGLLYDEDFNRKVSDGICEIINPSDLKNLDTNYLQELAEARSQHPDPDAAVQNILKPWKYMSRAEKVVELFYQDCTFETQLTALGNLRPHRRNDDTFTEPTLGFVPQVPIYSIIGVRDRVIRPNYSRYIAQHWLGAQAIIEIEGGHSLPIARRPIQQAFVQAIKDIADGKYSQQQPLTVLSDGMTQEGA